MRKAKVNPDGLLKKCGFRKTRQRLGVLEALRDAGRPITADEILSSLGKSKPDKVTVYRTLDSFVEAGLVHRAYLGDRTQHYELSHNCSEQQCHPHFTCTSCGKTWCMVDIHVPMVKHVGRGFIIHRQQVRLEGLCPECV